MFKSGYYTHFSKTPFGGIDINIWFLIGTNCTNATRTRRWLGPSLRTCGPRCWDSGSARAPYQHYDAMQTNATGVLQNPERPRASLVRDHQHGLVFESYQALAAWRRRHDLADASCSSIRLEDATGERVHHAHSPPPEEITA